MTNYDDNYAEQQSSGMEGAGGDAQSLVGGATAGVTAMHGHLQTEPKGFWHDAWSRVLKQPVAVIGLSWVGIVAFFAVFAPLVANGHPLIMWELNEAGERVGFSSPLVDNLSSVDVLLLVGGIVMPLWLLLPMRAPGVERALKAIVIGGAFTAVAIALLAGLTELSRSALFGLSMACMLGLAVAAWPMVQGEKTRSDRGYFVLYLTLQAGLIALVAEVVAGRFDRPNVPDWMRAAERSDLFVPVMSVLIALVCTIPFFFIPMSKRLGQRILLVAATGVFAGTVISQWWMPPLQTFDYVERERTGTVETAYVLIPYSPHQRQMELRLKPPGERPPISTAGRSNPEQRAPFLLGTDSSGQDLLSQLIHACRLSISIGLVATGIAVTIGVTLGSLMGYFGGMVDMLLYRVVEIFMSIPILFILILAAAVMPRNIYVMMAIIGFFTWTNAARYTRAEFMRLRDQDFVQAARALGLPMRSVLFRHMLPNGVTPVLVEASFAVAAAILFEAILSFLGLGPPDQSSWGRLLSEAFDDVGDFIPWLAIFPGLAIFLTVLSLVLVGEALRDAIDPKLKKAAQA